MNTLNIERLLAEKYHYAPLQGELSSKYRQFFLENTPSWMNIDGSTSPLFTKNGTKICDAYDRIVIGDYGAFVEFRSEPIETQFVVQPGQEYRIDDKEYSKRVKYIWMTIDDGSGIKIYKQKKRVTYADYLPKRYYVSVHECFPKVGGDMG